MRKKREPSTKGTPNVPEHVRGNAMRGAWQKGYTAAMAKVAANENPYPPPEDGNRVYVTYVEGMRRMWQDGWMAAVRKMAGVEK